jgi:type IV pilus assembly protein PilN
MARINLLPWREQLRKQRLIEFSIIAGLMLVLTLLGMFAWYLDNDDRIKNQQVRNKMLNDAIEEMDKKIKEIKTLEAEKSALLARMKVIEDLQGSRPEIVHLMDELVETIPEGVYLSKVVQASGFINLTGEAQSNARIAAYMRRIADSEWLGEADLLSIKQSQKGDSRRFELIVKQLNPNETEEE